MGGEEKTVIIMDKPSDGLYEKQKHGKSYSRRQKSLAFGMDRKLLAV